mmetsp:Transcript_5623/g.18950  ORF Transcript_5623/g.18950 Transcript_5623/m.18950 type:complete len:271 (+) Transcript_5623:246-1058(+)
MTWTSIVVPSPSTNVGRLPTLSTHSRHSTSRLSFAQPKYTPSGSVLKNASPPHSSGSKFAVGTPICLLPRPNPCTTGASSRMRFARPNVGGTANTSGASSTSARMGELDSFVACISFVALDVDAPWSTRASGNFRTTPEKSNSLSLPSPINRSEITTLAPGLHSITTRVNASAMALSSPRSTKCALNTAPSNGPWYGFTPRKVSSHMNLTPRAFPKVSMPITSALSIVLAARASIFADASTHNAVQGAVPSRTSSARSAPVSAPTTRIRA